MPLVVNWLSNLVVHRRVNQSLLHSVLPPNFNCRHITTHRHTHQSILTRIHPKDLYQIINNVDEYRHFLPHCKESKILQTSPCKTMMDAVLCVGLPVGSSGLGSFLEERYISRVKMMCPSSDSADNGEVWVVEAKSIKSNLFDSLRSRWKLSLAGEQSCNVNFYVEITVSNPLISLTLDNILEEVARKQVDAFEKRCRTSDIR